MLGILCGLEAEAIIARRINEAQVACAASRPQMARWLARELVRRGAKRLLSFGIAGGLEPGLPAGTIIVGTQVQSKDGVTICTDDWVTSLVQKFPEAHCGPLWGSEYVVASVKEKRSLYEKSRCLAVDLESHCVAQIALEADLPFAVLRVIADAAETTLPRAATIPLLENGKPDIKRVLLNLLRYPRQLPELFHLACGTKKAMNVLRATSKRMIDEIHR